MCSIEMPSSNFVSAWARGCTVSESLRDLQEATRLVMWAPWPTVEVHLRSILSYRSRAEFLLVSFSMPHGVSMTHFEARALRIPSRHSAARRRRFDCDMFFFLRQRRTAAGGEDEDAFEGELEGIIESMPTFSILSKCTVFSTALLSMPFE